MLETKFDFFLEKQRFFLRMQELNQGNLHYKNKTMSDIRNFFLDAKIFLSHWTIIPRTSNFQDTKVLFIEKFAPDN